MSHGRYASKGNASEATRWCGDVKIKCSFDDARSRYRCDLSRRGRKVGTQYVTRADLSNAADIYAKGGALAFNSPTVFDEVAHAAVSFALDAGQIRNDDIASKYDVRRGKL